MKLKSSLWLLGLCLAAPASAAAQTVYFSVGKEIRTLVAPAIGLGTLVHTSPMLVGDLALCAGNAGDTAAPNAQYLYFVEHDAAGDRISRLDVNAPLTKKVLVNGTAGSIFAFTTPGLRIGEIRLTPECNVLFAASTGVYQVNGSAPFSDPETTTPLFVTNGSGLAVAFDGSLRYSDGAAVKVRPSGTTLKSVASSVVGLGIANAGAGSTVPGWATAPLSVGRVCVSRLNTNTVACGSKTGTDLGTTLATFAVAGSTAVNQAQFFEFFTNDTAIVATSVNPNAGVGGTGAKLNGILWQVAGGVATELARGPKVNGEFVPIVGVAVGPSTSAPVAVTTVAGQTHTVNFGPVAFDVATPAACNVSISLRQLSWATANAKLNDVGSAKYLLDRGLGGESWVDDVVVVDAVVPNTCGMSPTTPAVVGIAQYIENAPSRAVLHCDGDDCDVATQGNFPYSTPDDERDSALPDNFSDFLTARIHLPAAAGIVFSTPLSNAAVVVDAIDQTEIDAATDHNASGGLSIRFRICANQSCTAFAPAEVPFPPTTGAGLSVTRLDEDGLAIGDCSVTDQGSSTPDLPVFRISSTDGTAHNFNLNTPFGGPPACQQNGLFVATVFSHGGKFTKTSILFRLR